MPQTIFVLILLLLTPRNIFAVEPPQTGQILWAINAKYYDFFKNTPRSIVHYQLTSSTDQTFILTQTGNGTYAGHENAGWTIISFLKSEKGNYFPVSTETMIKNQDGKFTGHWIQEFDTFHKIIKITSKNPGPKKDEILTLPLKGPTVDNNALILFLEKFAVGVTAKNPKVFYLLTTDHDLYKVNLKFVHEESLDLGCGPVKTVKLRLIADMGILDDIFDKFVPPTFVWLEPGEPAMKWVRYEGMETGAKSARVKALAICSGR